MPTRPERGVPIPDFTFEERAFREGHQRIAGIDEAGRGPWAGPVVAAAVILSRDHLPARLAERIDDSKKLKEDRREELLSGIAPFAEIGIGMASVEEIDKLNILRATMAAMARAAAQVNPDFALVDGNRRPDLPCAGLAVVKGDSLSLSIAAASIAAKVTRDRIMRNLDRRFPGFGWAANKGYGTAGHRAGLRRLGVTSHHRRSFAPIAELLDQDVESG